jgi:hypothetical protein
MEFPMNFLRESRMVRLIACACALLVAPALGAQTIATGNIEGAIADTTGAVLPGVAVVIRNLDTNATREATTDGVGRYRASALQPGRYEVSATLSGFQSKPESNIEVHVGQTVSVDLKMAPAGVAETVTVAVEAPVIDVRRTDVSNVVSQTAMENLPVTGRRWDNFVLLSPGVTNDGNFGLVSYRGISGLYNNNMVDGVDNNQAFFSDARGRNRIAYSISETSIREFQVGVSNMSAEFGRSAGGTVNAVTKSGTNTFSGEGFYFLRDKAFQARNPKVILPDPTAKPDERRQQFGAAVGGPIRKDKVFFFGDYDQQVRNFPIFTTTSNTTFLTGACAAPAANCSSTVAFYTGLIGLNPRSGDNKVGLAKVDVIFSTTNTLTLSINSHRWNSTNGYQTQPSVTVAPSANGSDMVKTDFFIGSLNTVMTQRTLNEFRFQVGRDFEEVTPNGVPPGTSVTGGISIGLPSALPRPAFPHEKRWQFIDSITHYRGGHTIKAGADINYVQEQLINLYNGGGFYSYSNLTAIANDCPVGSTGCVSADTGATTGRHYNTFNQAFDLTGLNGALGFNQWQQSLYVQDTWRVSNALLLNLGLRYDYQQLAEPGLKYGGVTFAGNPAYPATTRFKQDKDNLGPRIGFTYDFGGTHDTVIRGGYGTFYGLTSNSALFSALTVNGVSQASYSFTPTSPGAPAYPNTFASAPSATGTKPNLDVLSPTLERPMMQMVDVTLDRRVLGNMMLSASYLYTRGAHLPIFRDTNFNPANSQVAYVLDGQTVGTFPLYRGTRPDPNVGAVFLLDSSVVSRYNALVLQTNRPLSHGVMFNANYTLSKAEDNGQQSTTFFPTSYPDTYDPFSKTGPDGISPSTFDRRHRFVGTVYFRPSYLGGVGISSVVTVESGQPISENISGSLSSSIGAVSTGSTNGTNGGIFAPWLGRNSDRQQGRKTVDLRVSKQFGMGGGKKLEALWEVFNLFNWVNYTGASATAFNVASSAYDPAANLATVTLTRNSGFLVPTTIGNTLYGMRDMQLGLKLSW